MTLTVFFLLFQALYVEHLWHGSVSPESVNPAAAVHECTLLQSGEHPYIVHSHAFQWRNLFPDHSFPQTLPNHLPSVLYTESERYAVSVMVFCDRGLLDLICWIQVCQQLHQYCHHYRKCVCAARMIVDILTHLHLQQYSQHYKLCKHYVCIINEHHSLYK